MNATIAPNQAANPSRPFQAKLWTARIVGTLVVLFLLFDATAKIVRLAPCVEGTAKAGYPAGCLVPLGVVLLASTLLYVVRRTAVLGAILLTGYLGGAVATHVRLEQPFIMPLLFGVIVWACLYIRDGRIRTLLPLAHPLKTTEDSHG